MSLVRWRAAAVALLLTAYAARRSAPDGGRACCREPQERWRRACSCCLVDVKAMSAILAGLLACGLCAPARPQQRSGARAAFAFAAAGIALPRRQLTAFLDQAWFVLLGAFS